MVPPTFPIPPIQVGDTVEIYLPEHCPVYARDDVQIIPKYYAISVTPTPLKFDAGE